MSHTPDHPLPPHKLEAPRIASSAGGQDRGTSVSSAFTDGGTPSFVTDLSELESLVARLGENDAFVVDVETDSGNPVTNSVLWIGLAADGIRAIIPMGHPHGSLIKAAYSQKEPDMSTVRPYKNDPTKFTKPKLVTVHHPAEFGPAPEQLPPDVVIKAVTPLFFGDHPTIVGHNLKFDLMSLSKYFSGSVPDAPYVDTLILQHVLDENKTSYSLKNLTAEWALGQAAKNPELRKAFYPEIGKQGILNHSYEEVGEYLMKDISYTWWMYKRLKHKLHKIPELAPALALEMDLYPVLMRMELAGICIDLPKLEQLSVEFANLSQQLEQDMWREAGRQFELKPNDKVAVFFGSKEDGGQGLKPLSYTPKTNKPQVDKKFLEHYRDKNKLVGLMADHTELVKLRSTFVDKFLEPGLLVNGKVHGSLNQHRAETGRLSSSDPNLQQIPARSELGREFRKCFIPSPGYKMFVADYSQIELRCAAALSGDPELTRVLIANEDLHTAAASAAFRVEPEEVTPDQRAAGKTMNFLILYGGGSRRLADQIGVSVEEAERMIRNYFATYSRIPKWKDEIVQEAYDRGREGGLPYSVIPPFGRRRRVADLFADDKYKVFSAQRQLVNAVVQGFAANIMKLALIKVAESMEQWDARLLLTVHDEIIGEAEEEVVDSVFKGVLMDMESVTYPDGTPILGDIPLVAEGGIGDNWVESK